jgi:hypothetical protein
LALKVAKHTDHRRKSTLFLEVFDLLVYVGNLYQRKGFASGRMVDVAAALREILENCEDDVSLAWTVNHYSDKLDAEKAGELEQEEQALQEEQRELDQWEHAGLTDEDGDHRGAGEDDEEQQAEED